MFFSVLRCRCSKEISLFVLKLSKDSSSASLRRLDTFEWSHPVSSPISVVLNPFFLYSMRSSIAIPLGAVRAFERSWGCFAGGFIGLPCFFKWLSF